MKNTVEVKVTNKGMVATLYVDVKEEAYVTLGELVERAEHMIDRVRENTAEVKLDKMYENEPAFVKQVIIAGTEKK